MKYISIVELRNATLAARAVLGVFVGNYVPHVGMAIRHVAWWKPDAAVEPGQGA